MKQTPHDLLRAGQWALKSADWDTARGYFEAVLQQQNLPEAHDGLGIALWWLNKVKAAHSERTAAFIGFKERGDFRSAAFIAGWLAREQVFLHGNTSAMQGWFSRAESLLSQTKMCVETGWYSIYRASMQDSPHELLQTCVNTIELARQFSAPDLEAFCLAFKGMAQVTIGQLDSGMACIDEAMVMVISGETSNFMITSEVFCVTLSACELAGDLERTEHWCRLAQNFATRYQCPFLSAYCRTTYGSFLTATGRWQDADSMLTEAIRTFESGHYALRSHAVIKLAELRVNQGRLEEAEILLRGFEDTSEAAVPLARLQMAKGEHKLARSILEQVLPSGQISPLHQMPVLELMAELCITLGDMNSARTALNQLTELAQSTHSELLLAKVEVVRGQLKRLSGEADVADVIASALNRLRAYEHALVAGKARLEMAYLLQFVDWTGAVTWAKAALATFVRLGAVRETAETRKLMRTLGVQETPLQTNGIDLTQREKDVLGLVSHGLTNREIANRLYLSVKTVEHHVSQILGKLGVRTRTEAAAYAANREMNDPNSPR